MSKNMNILSSRAGVLESVANGVTDGIVQLFASARRKRDEARLADQLGRLSDRELLDIGLTRGDVPRQPSTFFGDLGAARVGMRQV